jgi:hypothetical protein
MSGAKDLVVKVIDSKSANAICKKYHYSGKVVPNSQIHFGVFLNDKCEGVMQFGPSLAKKQMLNIIPGTKMNEFIELNRMAFGPKLPFNSESRALSIAHKIIKKKYEHLKWIISFADACQCGDGAIYRAAGYFLHNIKKNTSLWINQQNGLVMQDMQFFHLMIKKDSNWKRMDGYMLRYIYPSRKELKDYLAENHITFDKIPNEIKMYKGIKRIEHDSNASGFQSEEGGAIPTCTLHL